MGINSLINSSHDILASVDMFVSTRVRWDGTSDPQILDMQAQLWRCLGVPEKMLPMIMEVNPVWRPSTQTLSVSA